MFNFKAQSTVSVQTTQ